jgi:phospholipid-binding lipoprotein MlaA
MAMNETVRLAGRVLTGLLLAVALSACATQGSDPEAHDPYEKTNRAVFKFNMALDRNVIKPVAKAYRWTFPDWTRNSIHSFLDNLNTPVYLANDLLQGDLKAADNTFARFCVNTLFGPAGLRDVARTDGHMEARGEDFGQTLAVWGVHEGPYLMVPFIGPSNPRDLGGRVVDLGFDPQTYVRWGSNIWVPYTVGAFSVVDDRSRNLDALDDLERTSVDFYASIRSLYRQAREGAVKNGEVKEEDIPNF